MSDGQLPDDEPCYVISVAARLTEDLGVNLAGVEVILNMSRRIEELQSQLATLQKETETELDALRQDIRQLEANRDRIGEQDRVIDSSATEVESNLEEGMS